MKYEVIKELERANKMLEEARKVAYKAYKLIDEKDYREYINRPEFGEFEPLKQSDVESAIDDWIMSYYKHLREACEDLEAIERF